MNKINKKILFPVSISAFILLSIWFYINNNYIDVCNVIKENKIISWDSMFPFLENWSKIIFLKDYYNICNKEIKKWDLVAYDYAWNINPLIKVVKIDWKDNVEIDWNIMKINWEVMKNSIWQIYIFSEWEINLISLYIKNWKIPENSYMIFWDNINDSIDSRRFWAISWNDILWKFDIKK